MSRTPGRFRRLSITTVITLGLITAVSSAVIASHTFPSDVPESNQFHGTISWLADNDITRGCNPPANDAYCPSDDVSREQMASFMRRFAQTMGMASDQATGASAIRPLDPDPVVVAEIQVTPKADASVLLDSHMTLTSDETVSGVAQIHRDSCSGAAVATGQWSIAAAPTVVSLSAVDEVDATTSYVLCAEFTPPGGGGAFSGVSARQFALTALWIPTS